MNKKTDMNMSPSEGKVTRLLTELSAGNRTIVNQLMPAVYDELHQIAERELRRERPGHTLNATALVHEAYMKFVDQSRVSWQNRAHFLAVAAQAMRRILINYARNRKAQKRGGGMPVITFMEEAVPRETAPEELLTLDEALSRLEKLSPRQTQVIEYWFFGGLTQEEIAEVLNISLATVRRDWRFARAWLSRELKRELKL